MHEQEETLLHTSRRFESTLTPSVKDEAANVTLPSRSRPSSLSYTLARIFEIQSVVYKEQEVVDKTSVLSTLFRSLAPVSHDADAATLAAAVLTLIPSFVSGASLPIKPSLSVYAGPAFPSATISSLS